jgi:hypothetical protein
MIFYGIERIFAVDENYSQMEHIGIFINEIKNKYPFIEFQCLGYKWQNGTMAYVIGKINEKPSVEEEITEVILPDSGWEKYSCELNCIEKLYRDIYKKGILDFEIENIKGNLFEVSIHRQKTTNR